MKVEASTGPVVRRAVGTDVDGAGALAAEAYVADGLLSGDDEYAAELRDAHRRAREAILLVAVVPRSGGTGEGTGGVVVGTVTLAPYGSSYAEVAEPGELEVRMLAVAPEARGRGVAEELMTEALRFAVADGARRVALSTSDAMRAAQRLYDRLGFVEDPSRDWAHDGIQVRVRTWTPPDAPGALVEAATWPPLRTHVTADGWRVGASGGLTRRANSALPVTRPADVEAA
ncbi:GNAT family N-acetyltransferase, partial [Cellulomonas biazotea]